MKVYLFICCWYKICLHFRNPTLSFLQYYVELRPPWTTLSWLVGSVRIMTYTLWCVISAVTVSSSATFPPSSAAPTANGTSPRSSVRSVSTPTLFSKCQSQEPNGQIHFLFLDSQQGDLTATDATTIRPTTSAESTRGTVQEVIEVNRRVTAISNQIIPSCPPAFHLNLLIFDIRRPFTFPPSRLAQSSPIMIRGALLDLTRTITISLFHLFIC